MQCAACVLSRPPTATTCDRTASLAVPRLGGRETQSACAAPAGNRRGSSCGRFESASGQLERQSLPGGAASPPRPRPVTCGGAGAPTPGHRSQDAVLPVVGPRGKRAPTDPTRSFLALSRRESSCEVGSCAQVPGRGRRLQVDFRSPRTAPGLCARAGSVVDSTHTPVEALSGQLPCCTVTVLPLH